MRTNEAGQALIKSFEGCRLEAYLCPAGVWTIGYGHTEGVKPGHKITQHMADVMFDLDLEAFEDGVETLCPGANENEHAALVSFAYNLGVTRLTTSTLRKKFLAGDKAGAADEFLKWTRAAGEVLPGLVRRRAAERELFLTVPA